MKKEYRLLFKAIILSVTVIMLCITSFAESNDEGIYYPNSETTTRVAETTTKGVIDKFISDSGIGDTVNKVMDNVNGDSLNGISDTISGAIGSLTDTISDTLGNYSSSIGGYFSGETTTASQTNNSSYSQFVVPTTQNSNATVPVYNNTQQQSETTTAVQQTQVQQTTAVQQTTPETTTQTTTVQAVQTQSEKQDNIWVFIVAVAMVIFAILFVLILLTRRTQYNSRVYDKSTLKSVKRSHIDNDIIDDDGDPLDNIMLFGNK